MLTITFTHFIIIMFTSVPKRSSTFVKDLKVDLRNSKAVVYLKTNEWYSSTTTRHINKYIGSKTHTVVDQSVINDLLKEQIPTRY